MKEHLKHEIELDLNLCLSDDRISNFISLIKNQIHTENEAHRIVEEIIDHLSCLIEDYHAMGHTNDQAIVSALKQMGDPTMIGYGFTNPQVMKNRNFYLKSFKFLGWSFLCTIFLLQLIFSKDIFEVMSGYASLSIYALYIYALTFVRFKGRKLKHLDINSTPLMIIWPVKNKISRSNLLIGSFIALVFSPILMLFLLMFIATSYEETGLLITLLSTMAFLLASLAFYLSEKFRIPKYVLCQEGIIVKGRFTPWIAIDQLRVKSDFMGETNHKIIELLDQSSTIICKKIKVHSTQIEMVKQVIYDKL